jgi:tetratricopeptide (TPR) repeat protein
MSRNFPIWLVSACLTIGCGPSVEDQVEMLASSPEEREQARQELLLAKDRAVEPLLRALNDPNQGAARAELVEVLVSLMTRVDDARIAETLNRLLAGDEDPAVRARIAQRMGLFKRAEAIPGLLEALEDEAGEVRHQALMALGELSSKLSDEQQEKMEQLARELVTDPHGGVRLEALIRIEAEVNSFLNEARQLALKAQVAEAESLYHKALVFSPSSKNATYQLGRFLFDNGRETEGMEWLRRNGMLLDVPRLKSAPEIDGRLEEVVWQRTARADSLFRLFVGNNFAAPPAEVKSRFYLGYTEEALYLGFHGHDAHPDSLVAKVDPGGSDSLSENIRITQSIWSDDLIELFFDASFDHRSFGQVGINSRGAYEGQWYQAERRGPAESWPLEVEVATHVGADFWSVEFKAVFDRELFPRPESDALWGFNLVRNYRGEQYNQWVRTYGNGMQPDQFGILHFQ